MGVVGESREKEDKASPTQALYQGVYMYKDGVALSPKYGYSGGGPSQEAKYVESWLNTSAA